MSFFVHDALLSSVKWDEKDDHSMQHAVKKPEQEPGESKKLVFKSNNVDLRDMFPDPGLIIVSIPADFPSFGHVVVTFE